MKQRLDPKKLIDFNLEVFESSQKLRRYRLFFERCKSRIKSLGFEKRKKVDQIRSTCDVTRRAGVKF